MDQRTLINTEANANKLSLLLYMHATVAGICVSVLASGTFVSKRSSLLLNGGPIVVRYVENC
jgi:hypothetical protein